MDASSRRSIWRHHLNQSHRTIRDRPRRRNGLIDVVDPRRGAIDVGVLSIVAEAAHPVEFADFCLSWWLELSDRRLQQNRVRTFAAGLESLIDQHCGQREARGIVGEGERASRVEIAEGGGCGEVGVCLCEVAFGEVTVGCNAGEATLLDELIDFGAASVPATYREGVSWRSRRMSGRSVSVRRNGSVSAASQAASLMMRGLTSRARTEPATREAS